MDFSNFKLDLTEEEVQEVDKGSSSSSGPRALGVGLHEVTITKVECGGPSKGDPSWERLSLSLTAPNGSFAFLNLLVPTESLKYGADNKLWAWKKLKKFLEATGIEVTQNNVPEVLSRLFSKASVLEGFKYQVELQYTGYHALPLDDKSGIALVNRDGEIVHDQDGDPVVCQKYEDVKNAAKELGHWYEGYPQVVGYGKQYKNVVEVKKAVAKKVTLAGSSESPF